MTNKIKKKITIDKRRIYENNRKNKEKRRIANTQIKKNSRMKMSEDKKNAIKESNKMRMRIAYQKKKLSMNQ